MYLAAGTKCGESKENYSFVARQPIVDIDLRVVGYELLFRKRGDSTACIEDDLTSTLSVLSTTLVDFGLEKLTEGSLCFINCSEDFLKSPALLLMPPERFVLEILETCVITPALIETCRSLRERGFKIALDDVCAYTSEMAQLLSDVDIVKVDWLTIHPDERVKICRSLSSAGKKVLAEKIEEWSAFHQAREAGATLFQGYFFSRPEIHSRRKISTPAEAVILVMQLIVDDASRHRLVRAVERSPLLLTKLLKLASSVAMVSGPDYEGLCSTDSALQVVGNDRLFQWCALILYVDELSLEDEALSFLALQRSCLMVSYVTHHYPEEKSLLPSARLTGAISVLDIKYGRQPACFWYELPLAENICAALIEGSGHLGEALVFAKSMEISI
ncbi:EAL and HDOD domain-containing protein [Paraburkholderia sp. XV]|uniref:EAL and HDOD domain-containing protein n=1 Tax=Paraburkholderia sp. XV TaxID=2831520 RepID=UPI001CD61DCD|nr:EAL domain-containing protein [Paraburkholderia sp. XV]